MKAVDYGMVNAYLRKIEGRGRGLDYIIRQARAARECVDATTPCIPSRNKREGRYAGKACFEWAFVAGWGMTGYQGKSRHSRSWYRGLRGLV